MGYRMNERLPLIHAAPENSGLYKELYNLAAKEVSCGLKIVRFPKNRILRMMIKGEVDFYPGFNFTEERASYAYYFDNGLPGGGDVGISRASLPEITNLGDLTGRIVLESLGGPDYYSQLNDVRVRRPPDLTLDKAVDIIRKKAADFYIYNRITIEYFLKSQEVTDIKIHQNCCGGSMPLYMAFSRHSPHFKEVVNQNYDPTKLMSIENFPTTVSKTTIAYKFFQALNRLANTGGTGSLAEKYYYGSN